ncbi:MAG TPA: tryptophan 7-halogenase, partial [Gemmatimonadaceae bacterium]|nr:tryptophan 7-halogenase [Gemmatimonadaceae bacterium]
MSHASKPPPDSLDAIVIGAGPAGSSAARLLAEWGHRVLLLTRPAQSPHLAESIPPSAEKLLHHLGWSDAVQAAGFVRSTGNTVAWSGDAQRNAGGMREAHYADGALGYQVDRGPFNELLLHGARATAARVLDDVSVTAVKGGDVLYVSSGESHHARAPWILDCSGRSGVCARSTRRPVPQLRTLALAAFWDRPDGWPLVDSSHTVVESHAYGWAWSIPLSEKRRQVTVMVDPRLTNVAGRADLLTAYETELRYASGLWDDTRGAT